MAATRTARTAVEALGRSAVLATRQAAKAKRVEEAATALKDSAPEKAFQITLRRSKIGTLFFPLFLPIRSSQRGGNN